jgi:hypothetical protein
MGAMQLPPPPAAQAGMAAMGLVPQQQAEQDAMQQAHIQQVMNALMSQLAGQPNPAAEAAQGMPAAQVSPDSGVPVQDSSMTGGAY